jgi:hypothetical protein
MNGSLELLVPERAAQALLSAGTRSDSVEVNFIDHRLDGPNFHVGGSGLGEQIDRHCVAHIEPLFPVQPQFIRGELPATRMLVVVAVNLSVALEAHGDRILDVVATFRGLGDNVVDLDFTTAETMAYATSPLAAGKKRRDVAVIEGHLRVSSICLDNIYYTA